MKHQSIDLLLMSQRTKYIAKEIDADAKRKASLALLQQLAALNGRCGVQIGVDLEFGIGSITRVGYEMNPEGGGVMLRLVQPRGELSLHVDGKAARSIPGLVFDGQSWVSDEVDENIVPEPGQPLPRKSAVHVVLRELLSAIS